MVVWSGMTKRGCCAECFPLIGDQVVIGRNWEGPRKDLRELLHRNWWEFVKFLEGSHAGKRFLKMKIMIIFSILYKYVTYLNDLNMAWLLVQGLTSLPFKIWVVIIACYIWFVWSLLVADREVINTLRAKHHCFLQISSTPESCPKVCGHMQSVLSWLLIL